MADIGDTGVKISDVHNTLGETTYDLFDLCTSSLINRWSRKKPVRDAGTGSNWPISSTTYGSGRYGLAFGQGQSISTDGSGTEMDLTNWTHEVPQGGSPGGATDEPGRLGDFRGYDHTPGDTDSRPVVGIVDDNAPSGTYYNFDIDDELSTISFSTSICTNDTVGITPDDMILDVGGDTIGDYYLAVYLTDGADTVWLSSSDDVNTGCSVEIDLSAAPYNTWSGTITWEAVVCDTADIDEDTWNAAALQNAEYCSLPTGTYGGKTYVNTGTFTIDNDITNVLEFQVSGYSVADETTIITGDAQLRSKIGSVTVKANNLTLKSSPTYDTGDTDDPPTDQGTNNIAITTDKTIGTSWTTIYTYDNTPPNEDDHFSNAGLWEGVSHTFTAYQKCYYGASTEIPTAAGYEVDLTGS